METEVTKVEDRKSAWGKLGADGSWHPLIDHCIDVATVFRSLIDLPNLGRCPLPSDEVGRSRLAVIAFLHDIGKCNRGFQAKADPAAVAAGRTAGHVMEAMALLVDCQDFWPAPWVNLLTEVSGWFADEEQALQILLASISHHGRPVSENDYRATGSGRSSVPWWRSDNNYDPIRALADLADAARRAFPNAFLPDSQTINATPALQQRFAGLVMLADWIGSDTQFFPYRASAAEDRGALAKTAAGRALKAIGLAQPTDRIPKPFSAIFPFEPTSLQAALTGTVEVSAATRLLLAESDTGSGKTEAALAWFFRLYAKAKVDGLYFALPTRVAARELYERVRSAISAAFEPSDRPSPVLLAAPGYVKVDGEAYSRVLPIPQGALWDDSPADQKRERLWSAERPKRFLAAPIAVGTIDQALLSALQVKHSLLRSVCLDRHLLVVDEVHASDPYMREVLRSLLRGHLERGGYALLLSATLGESAAAAYFDRDIEPLEEVLKRPYPLLSSRTTLWPMTSVRQRSVSVHLYPTLTNDDATARALVGALKQGARVLVICNTVARANALFRDVESLLQEEDPNLIHALFEISGVRSPHHGRFAREDREVLDAAVTARLGKGSTDGPRLLIGTQTLEQSLDIDADWLVTDLAPMDVLLQRVGRLHRHARAKRPEAFRTPNVLVRVPEKNLSDYLTKDDSLRAPAGLGSVYPDGRVLALTLAALRRHPVLELPAQARELIEHTTHPEAFATLPEPWPRHGNAIDGRELGEVRQAMRSVLDDRPFGDLHYADKSERIVTRLGRPSIEIKLEEKMRSPFGLLIERVSIPAHWLDGLETPEHVRAEQTGSGFSFQISKRMFIYTRFGMEKADV